MADRNATAGDSRVGWFAAGALAAAAAVALFLYADGYFDRSDTIELKIEVPETRIIEGQ